MTQITLQVPNVLASRSGELESLFELLRLVTPESKLSLDMSHVSWVYPYGLLGLIAFVHLATKRTRSKLSLLGIRDDVCSYLERVDFFTHCREWIQGDLTMSVSRLGRSDSSTRLLEVEPIRNETDIYKMTVRTRGIVQEWLNWGQSEQNQLIAILSEMCDNVLEHSGSTGHVAIQTYRRPLLNHVQIRIAVSDLGRGIPSSLKRRYKQLRGTDVDLIRAALEGRSARGRNITGNGFQQVRKIIASGRGALFVRSLTGAVAVSNSGEAGVWQNLIAIPGTQVSIVLTRRLQ